MKTKAPATRIGLVTLFLASVFCLMLRIDGSSVSTHFSEEDNSLEKMEGEDSINPNGHGNRSSRRPDNPHYKKNNTSNEDENALETIFDDLYEYVVDVPEILVPTPTPRPRGHKPRGVHHKSEKNISLFDDHQDLNSDESLDGETAANATKPTDTKINNRDEIINYNNKIHPRNSSTSTTPRPRSGSASSKRTTAGYGFTLPTLIVLYFFVIVVLSD